MRYSDFTYQKVYFVHCPECNENIVERGDERMVTTLKEAMQYAREHYDQEHKNQ